VPGTSSEKPKERSRSTINNLNLILGIDEEAEKAAKEAKEEQQSEAAKGGASSEAWARSEEEKGADARQRPKSKEVNFERDVSEQLENVMEQAKKLMEEKSAEEGSSKGEQQQLRKDFEQLLQMLKPDGGIEKEDIKLLKDKVFGPLTFWVTETRPTDELDGYLIRGNLRAPAEEVYPEVIQRVQKLFDGKYEILIVQDPNAEQTTDAAENIRPAFKLVPVANAYPPPQTAWQILVSVVLLTLTVGSSLQLGLVAEISKLPPETLQWLLDPDNLNRVDAVPPGLDNFDAVHYVESAIPIMLIVLGLQGVHEIGHRASALVNGTKLGPSFLIPNGQLGTFGSITQFKSMVRDLSELFDVSVAGPLAGGTASLAVFLTGLSLTSAALSSGATADLIPVPEQLLQGSLGLGQLTSLALGESGTSQVLVHPVLIAGWVGIYTTALNLLPVGCIDGGRITQAAFGKGTLAATSFLSYLALALGFVGGALSLPFGLYVLLIQRPSERYIQDSVTDVGESRKTLATVLLLLSTVVLLPNVPAVAESLLNSTDPQNFL